MSSAIATFCSTSSTATPSALTRSMMLEELSTMTGRKAERRLVQQQQARARHQRAGDRRHLLLPARKRSRRALEPIGRAAETSRRRARATSRRAAFAAGPVAAELQVFAHGHRREEPAALRHDRDTFVAESAGGQVREIARSQRHRAGRRPMDAGDDVDERASCRRHSGPTIETSSAGPTDSDTSRSATAAPYLASTDRSSSMRFPEECSHDVAAAHHVVGGCLPR